MSPAKLRLLVIGALLATFSPIRSASAQIVPITTHPRLWLRTEDLPRLRSWAVSSNPIYQDGLARLADQARGDMDAGRVPGQDPGNLNYREFPTEIYAELFAFLSLVSPDAATRADYADRARRLLMYTMNLAALGPADGQPFRDPCFASCDSNASKDYAEGFALTVDWIYPSLSPSDKATIRKVFLRWSDEIVNLGYHAPEPAGVLNDPVLVNDPRTYRWAFNNYFVAHMRNLGLMAMSLDAADDPGNQLRSYLGNATGARLYMLDYLTRNDAKGGLPPEGLEYGPGTTLPCIAQFLLALHTAGHDDPAVWGPQVSWFTANPFWDDWIAGWLHSQSPVPVTFADYIGPEYQPAWFGDGERYGGRETIGVFGPIGIYDGMVGNTTRRSKIRWLQTYLPPGGRDGLAERARNPNSFSIDVLYFLLFDPTAGPDPDPRASLPVQFYSQGLGRLLARTAWNNAATWFTYKLSWTTIDHQNPDGNQFELYRNGEWLVKERSGYDLDSGSSINHNTLALQNDPGPWEPTDYRYALGQTGSQWSYAAPGNPKIVARSSGTDFTYVLGDATNLYNYADTLTDITHASRSIVWLQPDYIVIYDRAASKTAGRFKRFWLNLPKPPTISGQRAQMTSASGRQQLFVTTLLPTDAAIAASDAVVLNGNVAENEPMKYRLRVEAPGGPQRVRFLHVLQGADAGAAAATPTLVQSSSGTPFVGAVVGNVAVLFPVDIDAPFTGVTYSVPVSTVSHRVTGLAPDSLYDVTLQRAGTITLTITPGRGSVRTDSGGVLSLNTGALVVTSVSAAAASSGEGPRVAPRGEPETPSPPQSARASLVTASSSGSGVVLSWIAPSNPPLRYVISGGAAPGTTSMPVIVTPDASTSYTIPSLPPGRYSFVVSGVFADAVGPASDRVDTVVTGSDAASLAPSGVIGVADGQELTLAWTRAERDATVYFVEFGTVPGRADLTTLIARRSPVTYRLGSGTYFVRVRAVSGAAVSAPSNELSIPVAPPGCAAAPVAPVLLPASMTSGETTFSWLPAPGAAADRYSVHVTGLLGPQTMISPGAGTSITTTLETGTYAVRVTAVNACGASSASNQITVSPLRN